MYRLGCFVIVAAACSRSFDVIPDGASGVDGAALDGVPGAVPDVRSDLPLDASPDGPRITGDAVQLNDVTIVLPLPTSMAELDGMMLASTVGDAGAVLPSAVYDAIGGVRSLAANVAYDSLRVVSLRIDPCAEQTAPDPAGGGCEGQLRLVLQPISPGFAGDAALHTFYRISRAEAFALVQAVVAARLASSNGEHLGAIRPHPLVVEQGLQGPFSTTLRGLIAQYAGATRLFRIAQLDGVASQQWLFRIFDVDPATGQVAVRAIPNLPPNTTEQTLTAFSGFAVSQEPAVLTDTFAGLAATNLLAGLSQQERATQFDALARVENPRINTPNTASCGSCHLAKFAKDNVSKVGFTNASSSFAFTPATMTFTPGELAPTFDTSASGFNVRALGYLGQDLSVIERVVHDSVMTVEYMNAALPR